MQIEDDLDIVTHGLADRLELLDREADRPARLEDVADIGQAPPDELPALGFRSKAALDQRLDRLATVVRIADDLVAHQPSQQLVDGHAARLALDVPQRNIDRRQRAGADLPGGEEASPKQRLPEVLDAIRI